MIIPLIKNSAGLATWEMEDLAKFLVLRGLTLTYDLMDGGFSVRKAKHDVKNPETLTCPPLIQSAEPFQNTRPSILPMKVTIRLKPEQRISGGRYSCTLRGETIVASVKDICFYSMSLIEALRAIKLDEIEDIKIDL